MELTVGHTISSFGITWYVSGIYDLGGESYVELTGPTGDTEEFPRSYLEEVLEF